MSVKQPSIEQYLLSTCLFIIDEFNELYNGIEKEELRRIANEKYNEMDITVKLGYPFRQMVHYTVGDKNDKKSNHDLFIESKEYKIEVKFPKNWMCGSGTYSNKKQWSEYQLDFEWLFNEITNGNKGKRAFVIGWFNCVETFSQLIQLGWGKGSKPLLNEERICYFPFLRKTRIPTYVADLTYNYKQAYIQIPLNLVGNEDGNCNCIFLGNEEDSFHFAIYF